MLSTLFHIRIHIHIFGKLKKKQGEEVEERNRGKLHPHWKAVLLSQKENIDEE